MRFTCSLAAGLMILVLLAGCSAPTTQKTSTSAAREPDLTLQVGSLNLSGFNKKIEKKEIEKFSRLLKKEQIEILSVQGITRYPGLESRVDFVNELVARSEMRFTFGEMFNSSGRQSGNGIFSLFPQRNSHNDSFDRVKSATFEAALQSSIDGGVKDIVVVSALLPVKASESDQFSCVQLISSKSISGPNQPMIVTGNLPVSESIRAIGPYEDVKQSSSATNSKENQSRMWFTNDGSLKLLDARTIETEFGPMLVAQFGLFR